MATVTVTEKGVVLQVEMTRDEAGVDRVRYSAASLTDVPAVAGRVVRDVDVTSALTPAQLDYIGVALDFIESIVKQQWNIP